MKKHIRAHVHIYIPKNLNKRREKRKIKKWWKAKEAHCRGQDWSGLKISTKKKQREPCTAVRLEEAQQQPMLRLAEKRPTLQKTEDWRRHTKRMTISRRVGPPNRGSGPHNSRTRH